MLMCSKGSKVAIPFCPRRTCLLTPRHIFRGCSEIAKTLFRIIAVDRHGQELVTQRDRCLVFAAMESVELTRQQFDSYHLGTIVEASTPHHTTLR
jgi:hypothetical protein